MTRLTPYLFFSIVAMIPLLFALAAAPNAAPINTPLTNILNFLTITVQILITFALIVAGWGIVKLIASAGNPQQIKNAKAIIFSGIIGIFVLSSMFGILTFIKTYIGIPDNSPIQISKFTK